MLKIKPPNYKFCPFCGKKLKIKIEENKKRKFCPSCNWVYYPHVAASVAAVILKNKKVLLVKRKREPYSNSWMFPAGFIEYGEHPEETLKREVKEETGLKIKKIKLIAILQSEDDPRSLGHFMFFYKVKTEGKEKNLDLKENKKIGWFEIANLPLIKWKAHRQIIKGLQKELNFSD